MLRRAAGEASFAADIARPGALHLAIRRSPVAHGRIRGTDITGARSLPGVALILTSDDDSGLLDPELRYVGDRAALVAAEDVELARRGAALVILDVEPLAASLDPGVAPADEARVLARVTATAGDPDGETARADRVIEGTWTLPFVPSVPLEPSVAMTWLDEDRRLVVRTSAESPFRVRGRLAELLGLPAARIRVARPLVAGRPARRSSVSIEDLCALVTLRTGRPARLALTAEEELTTAPGHPPQQVVVRLGVRSGRIASLRLRLVVDLGDGSDTPEEILRSAGRQALGTYAVPHVGFEAMAVRTHRPPTCAPRGADHGAAFALESALDEAARALGEDPLRLRKAHLGEPTGPLRELLETLGESREAGDENVLARLLDTGAAETDWTARAGGSLHVAGSRRARGVALARRSPGGAGGAGAAASLRLLDDGSLTLSAAPSSAGGADETVYAEVAASIVGVPPRRVVPAATDTDSAPFQSGDPAPAFFATGRAVEEAARLMRQRLEEEGARILGVDPSVVTAEDGAIRGPGGRHVDYAAIGSAALREGRPLVVTASPSAASAPSSNAAVFADVEIDEGTGVVTVAGLTAVLGGGPFDDPRPAEGQVEGALCSAVEQALAASLPLDGEGRPSARSMRQWPFAAARDAPPIFVRFVATGKPAGRFGAVAVGEPAARAALAAIAGAVAAAAGGRVHALPLLPPRVLEALRSRDQP